MQSVLAMLAVVCLGLSLTGAPAFAKGSTNNSMHAAKATSAEGVASETACRSKFDAAPKGERQKFNGSFKAFQAANCK